VLAFEASEILRYLDAESFVLLVVHSQLIEQGPEVLLSAIQGRTEGAFVLLGPPKAGPPFPLPHGRALFLDETTAPEILVDEALSLIGGPHAGFQGVAEWGALRLDRSTRCASWRSVQLDLTRIEFMLLELLCEADGAVVEYRTISRRLWGTSLIGDSAHIHAHVARIRRKLEQEPTRPTFLLSVRGHGLRLAPPVNALVAAG
jgi:hypothetical protein